MPHDVSLIATVALGLVFAFICGFIAARVKVPPMVGYLVAGIIVGPYTRGFVADATLAPQLAEIGVILLMFGVGMHFSVSDLMAVRKIAVPGALGQIASATLMGAIVALMWGWSLGAGLVFGLALAVTSTVVLLKALEGQNAVDTPDGRIAVGWLVVEDLAMVLTLVLLPALADSLGGQSPASTQAATLTATAPIASSPPNLLLTLAWTLGKVVIFSVLMLVVGARVFPWLLKRVERTGSRELFTLAVIAIALGVAFGSAELFGVSFALGAFFVGMVVNGSDLSHRAAREMQPIQDVFAALFFVAVGMLFDPGILLRAPVKVLVVLAIIVVGKSLAAAGIVLLLRYPKRTALTVSAALAQIGEFSFILATLGVHLHLISDEANHLIIAGALFSITLNPVAFLVARRLSPPATA